TEAMNMINQIFGGGRRGGAPSKPALQPQGTVANNTLIVPAPDKGLGGIREIIKKIDVPNSDMLAGKTFHPKVVRATDLEMKVNLFLATLGTNIKKGQMKPGCFAEPATNTLLVFAPKEYMTFIEGVVNEIESQQLPESDPKFYTLKIARADQVSSNIE